MSNKEPSSSKETLFPLAVPATVQPQSFSLKVNPENKENSPSDSKSTVPPLPRFSTTNTYTSIDEKKHSNPPKLSLTNNNNDKNHSPSPSPEPHKRIKGIICRKPIIYGNVTHRLDGKPDSDALAATSSNHDSSDNNRNTRDVHEWFRWTVYVRGVENEDLSYFIKRVVFILHETYVNPIRVVERSPFEVSECGWGQFEVKIEIYFHSQPDPLNDLMMSKMDYSNSSYLPPSKRRKLNNVNDIFKFSAAELTQMANDKQMEIVSMFNVMDGLPHDADTESMSDGNGDNGYEHKLVFLHLLRLFAVAAKGEDHSKNGIVDEKYAIIEFYEPYYCLFERLWIGPQKMCAYDHPFWEKYWKHKVVQIANKEQKLIKNISKCHRDLLQKIEQTQNEYQQLLTKSN